MNNQFSRRSFLKNTAVATLMAGAAPGLTRAAGGKKVVVAGAGLAGLTAAFELTNAGYDVTVLEARNRPGGRVFTVREPFTEGLYAEAGALAFPETHDFTMKYVKRFGLQATPTTMPDLFANYYVRGKRIRLAAAQPVPWPQALSPEERRLGMEGMQTKYLTPGLTDLGDPKSADWPTTAQSKFDGMTFSAYLLANGASDEAIALLRLGYFDLLGDGVDTASALSVLRDAALGAGTAYHKIQGGNDRLPHAFANQMKDRVKYGCPIVRIHQDANHAEVTFLEGGVQRTLSCDRLVCTLPFSVLKKIAVTPGWSAPKRAAIDQLAYTSVSRTFLQMKKRFWDQEGFTGYTVTDTPAGLAGDATMKMKSIGGILESYVTGPQARRITAMSANERVPATLAMMEQPYPGARENFVRGASKCWDEDEWSQGAYAWFRPGQMMSLIPHIPAAEGRVHFAGEHTSAWPGWMQGAIQSGDRVVKEVLAA